MFYLTFASITYITIVLLTMVQSKFFHTSPKLSIMIIKFSSLHTYNHKIITSDDHRINSVCKTDSLDTPSGPLTCSLVISRHLVTLGLSCCWSANNMNNSCVYDFDGYPDAWNSVYIRLLVMSSLYRQWISLMYKGHRFVLI